jgi:chorismate mutase/prephenate dehydratase
LRGEKWQYVFFVDVECDLNHEDYRQLVDELKHVCHSLRILGSYPAGMYFDVARTADGSERLVTE